MSGGEAVSMCAVVVLLSSVMDAMTPNKHTHAQNPTSPRRVSTLGLKVSDWAATIASFTCVCVQV